jgi:hypothetical protein
MFRQGHDSFRTPKINTIINGRGQETKDTLDGAKMDVGRCSAGLGTFDGRLCNVRATRCHWPDQFANGFAVFESMGLFEGSDEFW